MAVETLHAFDTSTGAFNSADLYVCRKLVPKTHRLVDAHAIAQNLVTTGIVTVTLRRVDLGGPRAGALVGTPLDNTQLAADANTASASTKRTFVLAEADKQVAPVDRIYLLVLASDNSADRFDEACLVLEVEKP